MGLGWISRTIWEEMRKGKLEHCDNLFFSCFKGKKIAIQMKKKWNSHFSFNGYAIVCSCLGMVGGIKCGMCFKTKLIVRIIRRLKEYLTIEMKWFLLGLNEWLLVILGAIWVQETLKRYWMIQIWEKAYYLFI